MKKCLVRERIDVDGEWKVSYMHKVWDDGTAEFYIIAVTPHPQLAHNAKITEAQWLKPCQDASSTGDLRELGLGLWSAGGRRYLEGHSCVEAWR